MASPSNGRQRLRFGLFEADLASGELYKHGHLIRVQEQPFRILVMLLERPGEIVSREEVQKKLWPEGTFVDFDEGLDTALKKLRQALGDSPQNPVFVETIPRRGYRFIAPVQVAGNGGVSIADQTVAPTEHNYHGKIPEADLVQPMAGPRLMRNIMVAGVVAIIVGATLIPGFWPPRVPKVSRIVQLTHSIPLDPWGKITTDGARLFFLEREGDHWNSMQAPVSGGESQPFPAPFRNTRIMDISPELSEFLIAPFTQRSPGLPFWTMPVVGGAPRRLGNIVGDDAVFSPDGSKIAYLTQDGIYICSRTGTDVKKLASLTEPSHMDSDLAWSPDGKVLRFRQVEEKTDHSSLWEVSADGRSLHPLFAGWHQQPVENGGGWSPDGRYYFFLSSQDGILSIWVRQEKRRFPYLSKPGPPIRLTSGPMGFYLVVPSHDGRRLYTTSGKSRSELVQQDRKSKQFVTRFRGEDIGLVSFSRKGDRIALIRTDGNLWQSRPDGTERVQLTAGFGLPDGARWSPDGTRILFTAVKPGAVANIYQVRAEGGAIEELLPQDVFHAYPDWSPEGGSIAYTTRGDKSVVPPADGAIYVLDLATRKTSKVPGSDGLMYPRWSPDGKYLAAFSEDWGKAMLFNFQTHQWKEIAHGNSLSALTWSPDAKYLYFEDILGPHEPIYRIRPADSQAERVMDFESLLATGASRCQFIGFAPDDSVMAIVSRSVRDIYELDLELP